VLFGSDSKFVVESVVPDLVVGKPKPIRRADSPTKTNFFHVVPVGDDTVLNRVLEREDTTLRLSLVSNVGVLLPVIPYRV
jgi:hypothetical protein